MGVSLRIQPYLMSSLVRRKLFCHSNSGPPFSIEMYDDDDIQREIRSMFIRTNVLARRGLSRSIAVGGGALAFFGRRRRRAEAPPSAAAAPAIDRRRRRGAA